MVTVLCEELGLSFEVGLGNKIFIMFSPGGVIFDHLHFNWPNA